MPYELSLVVLRLIAVLEVSWLLPACQTFNFERLSLAWSYSKVYQSYFQLLPTKFPEDFFSILSFFLSLFFFLFLLFFFPFFQIQIRHIFAWHLRLIKLASASIHCLKLFRRFPLCFRNESKKFPSPKSGIFFIFESLQCHWTIGGTFFSFFDVNKSDDSYIFVFVSHFLFFIYLFISFFFFRMIGRIERRHSYLELSNGREAFYVLL